MIDIPKFVSEYKNLYNSTTSTTIPKSMAKIFKDNIVGAESELGDVINDFQSVHIEQGWNDAIKYATENKELDKQVRFSLIANGYIKALQSINVQPNNRFQMKQLQPYSFASFGDFEFIKNELIRINDIGAKFTDKNEAIEWLSNEYVKLHMKQLSQLTGQFNSVQDNKVVPIKISFK